MSGRGKPKQGVKRPIVTRSATGNQRPKQREPAKKAKPTSPAEDVEIVQLSTDRQSDVEGVLGNDDTGQREHFIDFENVLRRQGHLNANHTHLLVQSPNKF